MVPSVKQAGFRCGIAHIPVRSRGQWLRQLRSYHPRRLDTTFSTRRVADMGSFPRQEEALSIRLFDSFFPNRNLRSMNGRMDDLFDDPFFHRSWMLPGGRSAGESLSRSPWDFVETDDAFRMRLDLPGLSNDEVQVHVEDGNLVLEGEHSEENKAEEAQWSSTSNATRYSTRILLPENANAEMMKAELKNGVLSVTIPKVVKEEPKKNVIEVQIE